MKKIEFLKQGLENFCNHIEPLEIDFTKGSITLITGPNGIGKTSIFQAIPFTLYGQCEKGRGDDVLNSKTGKNCHTWTIFKINEVEYRVDRYVKYTRLGNSVTITKGDDTKPYLKGHKEVVPEVEKLLMPYKLFMNTLLFSQKVKSFFTDLGDADQKEIFRKIMTLDDFVLYMQQCGVDLKSIEATILELNQTLAVNEGLLDSTKEQLEILNKKHIEFDTNQKIKIVEIIDEGKNIDFQILEHVNKQKELPDDTTSQQQVITNKISVFEHQLNNLDIENDKQINVLDNQKSLKISELEKKSLEMSNIGSAKMSETLGDLAKEHDESVEECNSQLKIINDSKQKLIVERTELSSSINFIENEIESLNLDSELTYCPTCKREINDESRDNISNIIADNEKEIDIRLKKIKEINDNLDELVIAETSWNEILKKDKQKYNESCQLVQYDNRESIRQFIERRNIAVNKVEVMMKDAIIQIRKNTDEERDKLRLEISDLTFQFDVLVKLQEKIDLYNQTLQALQNNKDININNLKETTDLKFDDSLIKDCETKLQEYINIINETLVIRNKFDEQIKRIQFWKVGFSASGIQSMLIDEAIPFMNERISYYMDMLCNGRYKVTFDTLKANKGNKEFRDKISVNVFDTQTHSDKRVKFSGGQTRLVDIGTILTLADLMANVQDTSVNIILFDEIFDSLDSENIRHASNLLREAAKEKWVGIISHTKIDDIEADNHLEFR